MCHLASLYELFGPKLCKMPESTNIKYQINENTCDPYDHHFTARLSCFYPIEKNCEQNKLTSKIRFCFFVSSPKSLFKKVPTLGFSITTATADSHSFAAASNVTISGVSTSWHPAGRFSLAVWTISAVRCAFVGCCSAAVSVRNASLVPWFSSLKKLLSALSPYL